ncbi:hypothetical protein ACHAXT_007564 [Thalassiosira profunda]
MASRAIRGGSSKGATGGCIVSGGGKSKMSQRRGCSGGKCEIGSTYVGRTGRSYDEQSASTPSIQSSGGRT